MQRFAWAAHERCPAVSERRRGAGRSDFGAEFGGMFRAEIAATCCVATASACAASAACRRHAAAVSSTGCSRRAMRSTTALDGRAAAQGECGQLNVEPCFDRGGELHGHQRVHAHVQEAKSAGSIRSGAMRRISATSARTISVKARGQLTAGQFVRAVGADPAPTPCSGSRARRRERAPDRRISVLARPAVMRPSVVQSRSIRARVARR